MKEGLKASNMVKRKRKKFLKYICLIGLLVSTGCGTVRRFKVHPCKRTYIGMKDTGDVLKITSEAINDWGQKDNYAAMGAVVAPFYIIMTPFTLITDTLFLPADLIACNSFKKDCEFWDNIITGKDTQFDKEKCQELFESVYMVSHIWSKCKSTPEIPDNVYLYLYDLLRKMKTPDKGLLNQSRNLTLHLAESPYFANIAKELIIQVIKVDPNDYYVKELAKKNNLLPYIYLTLLQNGHAKLIASSPSLPKEVYWEALRDPNYCTSWPKLAANSLMTNEMLQILRANASKLLSSDKANQLSYEEEASAKRAISHIDQLDFWSPIFTSGKLTNPYDFYKSNFTEDTFCLIHDIAGLEEFNIELANLSFDLSLELIKQQKPTHYYYFPSIVQRMANNKNIDIKLFKKIYDLNGSYWTTNRCREILSLNPNLPKECYPTIIEKGEPDILISLYKNNRIPKELLPLLREKAQKQVKSGNNATKRKYRRNFEVTQQTEGGSFTIPKISAI